MNNKVCPNCNFENEINATVCGNCGIELSTVLTNEVAKVEDVQGDNKPVEDNPRIQKKSKKKLFIFGGIGLALVIATILIITLLVKSGGEKEFKDPFKGFSTKGFDEIGSSLPLDKYREVEFKADSSQSGTDILKKDFESGFITANDYVLQYAYNTFGDRNLSSKYKSSIPEINADVDTLLELANKHFNDLDDDTITYILQKVYLLNYKIDVGAKQTSNTYNNITAKQMGKFDSTLYSLNKVTLSKDKHFLVYYATTGNNKVSDEYANKVADLLEYFVGKYKQIYGLDFKYQFTPNLTADLPPFPSNTGITEDLFASALLTANGINQKYLLSAMPIYIIDTGSGILGFSAGSENVFINNVMAGAGKIGLICHILSPDPIDKCDGDNIKSLMATAATYSLPFIAISSHLDFDSSTDVVVGHELFHHYQRYICGDGKYKDCPTSFFDRETTANLSPILAKESDGIDLGYTKILNTAHAKDRYFKDIEESIDRVGISKGEDSTGYGAYIFAYNYVKLVPNGVNIMRDSGNYEKTFNYLYDQAGEKFKDVMITTAEKNLTHDYSLMSLIAMDQNKQIVIPPGHRSYSVESKDEKEAVTMNRASTHYYYVHNVNMFTKNQQLIFTPSSSSDKMEIILFIKKDGKYYVAYKEDFNKEFKLNISNFKNYSGLAIAIVDYSKVNGNTYTYEYKVEGEDKKDAFDPKKINDSVFSSLGVTDAELVRARSIYCRKSEGQNTYMSQKSEVLVNYKNSNRIKDLYVKESLDMSGIDKSSPAYGYAKNLLDVSFRGIEQLFNMYFKDCKTIY